MQEALENLLKSAIDNAELSIRDCFDGFLSEAGEAIEAEALKRVRKTRLREFYLNNNIAFVNFFKNIEFAKKIKNENLSASIMFSSIATESVVMQAIVKPLIFSSIVNEDLSQLITSEFKKKMNINKAKSYLDTLIKPILGDEFLISSKNVTCKDKSYNLWNSRVGLSSVRNKIAHDGSECKSENDVEFSILISEEFKVIAISILNEVGLCLDEKNLIRDAKQVSLFDNEETNENNYPKDVISGIKYS